MIRDLGPCSVTFDSVDLGSTKGGVKFKFTEDSKPVNEDQKGVTNVDEIKVGVSACEVEVPLTRSTLAQLAKVIGGATQNPTTKLSVSNEVGVSMYEGAALLILKPIVNGVASTNTADWLNIPKAYPKVDFEITFDNEGQRVYKTTFKGFPDASSGLIWFMGL
jgi:hypothetical protein